YSGEPAPTDHRPWIGDPTVVVGETEVPLSWGRWWRPLPVGRHSVEVAIARQGEGVAEAKGDRYTTWDDIVEVAAGWVTHLRLNGSAVQYYENGRYSLRLNRFEYTGRSYQAEGRLVEFHRPRLEVEPLHGQTDLRPRLFRAAMSLMDSHSERCPFTCDNACVEYVFTQDEGAPFWCPRVVVGIRACAWRPMAVVK